MTAEHRAHEHSNTQPRVSSSTSHDHAAAAAAAAYALPFQTGAASASSSNSRGFDDPAHYGHDEAFAQLIQRAIRMGEGAAAGPPPPPPPPASTSSVAAAAAAAIAAVAPLQKPQPGATRDPAQVHLELIRKRLEAAEKPTTEKGLGAASRDAEDGQAGEMGAATVETGPATTTSATLTAAAAPLGAARSPSSQSLLPATTPTTAAAAAAATTATDGTTTTTTTTTTPTTSKPGRGPGSRARWTPAEDRKLVQFVHYSDPPLTWDEIGAKMGRAATGCSMRWYKYLRDKSTPPAANRESLGLLRVLRLSVFCRQLRTLSPAERASPAAATASGEGAAERMTSTAASGDEEASRVDASGHHHDKGKGKETASTPGALTVLSCRACSRTHSWSQPGSSAFWTGASFGRRSRPELVPASRSRTATATATAIAIAIATGAAAAATARAEQRDGRRWFVQSGAAAARRRQGGRGAREHQGGGTVAADGGEG